LHNVETPANGAHLPGLNQIGANSTGVERIYDFLTVKDLDRSIAFYETALKPLGIVPVVDYNGKDGPEGHPDLEAFGRDGHVFFWLKQGQCVRQVCAYRLCRQGRGRGECFLRRGDGGWRG
jgi:hypothetical protein